MAQGQTQIQYASLAFVFRMQSQISVKLLYIDGGIVVTVVKIKNQLRLKKQQTIVKSSCTCSSVCSVQLRTQEQAHI